MNLKDKLIRKILDFGKKHRLMVYPSLALVAIISAISHAVYWGKGNGKRLVASVTVVALLVTQSLFLTSSAADEEQPQAPQTETPVVQENVEPNGETDENEPVADSGSETPQEGTGDTVESDAAGETSETNTNGMTDGMFLDDSLMSVGAENSITVKYYRVTPGSPNNVATELGTASVTANDQGKYVVSLPTDKAALAFSDSAQASNFTFTDWYADISCTGSTLTGTVTLDADASEIADGVYDVYFMATRTKYPLAVMDGETQVATKEIAIQSPTTGVINPEVTYTVEDATGYGGNVYKTGYKFAGLNYNGFYSIGDPITISPSGYVASIAMNAEYTAYELDVTFDGMADENTDKNIQVTGSDQIVKTCTYGQTVTLPDSKMGGQVDSEAYYIKAWDINGTEYDPGAEINGTILFKALNDKTLDPNIEPYTVKAVWAYKEVKLASSDSIISAGVSGATITTTYGDTISASIHALYQNNDDGSGFSYSISEEDNQKLASYGISYSLGAEGSVNTGVTFFTSDYVKDVTTGIDITVTVEDTNKLGSSYPFTVTLVVNPKQIAIVADSVKSSNGLSAPTKPYDGTTSIDVLGTASLEGVLDADSGNVSVSFNTQAELDSAGAGSGKTVTLSNVILGGDASSKYTLKDVGTDKSLTIAGIGTVEKRTLSIVMELAEGEDDTIYFGERTPNYVLSLTEDSVSKLASGDQSAYATMDSTEFIRQYLGFTGFSTARTEYSNPGTYTISPVINSSGKNYTADASGLSASFTVSRLDGTNEYILDGDLFGGYYKGLSISPTNGYTKIRRINDGDGDIAEGTSTSTVNGLAWKSSIDIEDMTDGTIRFQMMSDTGAITEIVTLEHINVDTKGPELKKIVVSPNNDIKDYIKEYGFGSYYHSQDGIESIRITLSYSSDESACKYLHYYFVDDTGRTSGETLVPFQSQMVDGYYVATINIGTSSDQRGQLVVYAENDATNVSERNKIKLNEFTKLSSDVTYYEWMVENNISGADIMVTGPDGGNAVTNTVNSDIWYNSLNLSVEAADSESGVGKITWNIQTPNGTITPAPVEIADATSLAVISKAEYGKIYEYIFQHVISGDDMPAGAYTISATLEDNAGNSVVLDSVGPYNVDCKPPVIDVDAIADSDIYQSGVELSFDVSEGENESGIASVELVKLDGSNTISIKQWTPQSSEEKYAMACSYKIVSSGTYQIIVTDCAGNESTERRTFNKLSTTVPATPVITVTGTEGNNGWYMGEDTPNAEIDCQILTSDGVKVTTYYKIITENSSNQVPLPSNTDHVEFALDAQGEITIEAWSVSEAGIESTHAIKNIKADTVRPTIDIVNATVDAAGDMYINFRVKDSTSGVNSSKVLLNGQAVEVTEETNAVVGSFKAEGTRNYTLSVEDMAGNVSETFTFSPLALNVAPVTNITSEGAYLEAEVIEGTYDISDYYIALKKHGDTAYRTCLMNESVNGKRIELNSTFRGLSPDTVYDYKVYASNEKAEVKSFEGSFRTLSTRASGSVYGEVTYADNIINKDYPVYVSLYEANTVVASTRLENADDTGYLFTNLSDGSYRVVATNGALKETAAVTIENGGIVYPENYAANGGVKLVLNGYNTSVVIEDDAINITADGLESLYDNSIYHGILTNQDIAVLENGGSIDISLHASYIDVSDISSEEQSIFAAKLSENAVIERYINLYVLKEVWDADGNYVNNTPAKIPELYEPITISFPLGELAGQQIYVASVHGEGSNYSFMNWANADDAVISKNYVTITTRFFSVYALYRIIPSDKTYQVTWKDGDGNTMKTETVKEGMAAVPPTATPTKNPSDKYTYTFSGWDTDYSCITKDTVIAAWFTAHKKDDVPDNPTDPTDPTNPSNPDNPNNAGTTTTPNAYTYLGSADSPKTGDATPIVVMAVLMVLSGAGMIVLKKKKMQS